MKTVAILGSTGSIGSTSLEIIKKYSELFKIVLLFANKNYKKINSQYKIYKPQYICLNNKKYLSRLKPISKKLNSIDDFLKNKKKIDYVISAVSGYGALDINFKILKNAKKLLIANKETIICGNKIFLNEAKKYNCEIIPIDSEHYCINYFLKNFRFSKLIKSFYLTASGGPFANKKPSNNISIKKVLKHPNWKMGKKNSINSANMVNKILELFEAHIIFKIPKSKLGIKIEKKSKIHSVISLKNGLDFYISHLTSMKIPIENSLISEKNLKNIKKNLSSLQNINFELSNPDNKVFPILRLGYKILKLGYRGMILFTVLNDRLVDMFLSNKKKFNDIVNILNCVFKKYEIVKYSKQDIRTLTDIKNTINFANRIKL